MIIYVSTDIESNGPAPGLNSMLSFGSVAYTELGQLISTFTRNLHTVYATSENEDTMKWWETQPEAWEVCRKNLVCPKIAMKDYVTWLKDLPGKPIFVGYPASFDFMFIYYYLMRFVGESPFGFQALDIKTLAAAKLNIPFNEVNSKTLAPFKSEVKELSHEALDDAIQQGKMFFNLIKYNLQKE